MKLQSLFFSKIEGFLLIDLRSSEYFIKNVKYRSGKKRLASDLASTAGPPLESPAKKSRVVPAKRLGEKKNIKAVVAGGKGKDASTVIGGKIPRN